MDAKKELQRVAATVNETATDHWDRVASEGAYAAVDALCDLAATLTGLDAEELKALSVAERSDGSAELNEEQTVADLLNVAIAKREAYESALRDIEVITGEIDDLGEYLEYPAADVIAMGESGEDGDEFGPVLGGAQ